MEFKLKRPCPNCPYRKDCPPGWLTASRAAELAAEVILGDKSFACHKTVNYEAWRIAEEEGGEDMEYTYDGNEQFCAGAMILEKKCNQGGNLAVRIGRMFRGFKYEDLKGEDLVFDNTAEFIKHHSG